MVLLIIIPMKNGYFIGNIPDIFRQTQIVHVRVGVKNWWKGVVGVNTGWIWMVRNPSGVNTGVSTSLWLSAWSKARKPFNNVHMQCHRADWVHERQNK